MSFGIIDWFLHILTYYINIVDSIFLLLSIFNQSII